MKNIIIKMIEFPPRAMSCVRWLLYVKSFKTIGKNSHVGKDFSILGAKYVSIGHDFRAGQNFQLHAFDKYKGVVFQDAPEIMIGNNVTITDRCYISCANRIEIGDGVLFGPNVFIVDNFHGNISIEEIEIPPNERPLFRKGRVKIGSNVWIGRNVCVMPGVSIGDNAIIGANAVVTHDIPANSVAAGIPAKVIRKLT